MKDDQLSSLHNQNVEEILRSSTVQTVFCYENKPEWKSFFIVIYVS